jgi:hypothetical protein
VWDSKYVKLVCVERPNPPPLLLSWGGGICSYPGKGAEGILLKNFFCSRPSRQAEKKGNPPQATGTGNPAYLGRYGSPSSRTPPHKMAYLGHFQGCTTRTGSGFTELVWFLTCAIRSFTESIAISPPFTPPLPCPVYPSPVFSAGYCDLPLLMPEIYAII